MHAPLLFARLLLSGLSIAGCGSRLAPKAGAEAPVPSSAVLNTGQAKAQPGALPDVGALFPSSDAGWKCVSAADRTSIAAFASDYLGFLHSTGTQRAAAAALATMATRAGAVPFDGSGKHKAGDLLLWQDQAHSSLALLRIGERSADEGLHLIVASTDGGVIRLTPTPGYEKSGLALFDTTILGGLQLESWLNTPLVLDVSVADAEGAITKQVRIGDQPEEPVFTIPDLLPHLSRKVQREGLVDSAERLDALAAFSLPALTQGLKDYGLSAADWNRAEAELLPAQAASYIGVDRALIAGANHAARAFPFAAVRALLAHKSKHTTLVILMGHSKRSYAGAEAEAHVTNLLPLAIAQQRPAPDALDLRRIYARTKVMLYDHEGGTRNQGIVLNSRKDDATPEALRYLLQRFEKSQVQFQIAEDAGWSEAREVASLDMDAVEVGLPIEGVGTPSALLSTLDLYQALLACQAWVQQ